ncbi:hypothetical protein [Helicobacter sp. MIT 05-5294]|uniref:hypothetical protein n=1 Tax=Helicobacter sp. MIT 05-5294 TaxID=1548150 RepID=UPI00051FB39B|nr:hypothetical protein [Helicobacter sp. MIT 05-5294]TLD84231.1 hypothetical protein LS69_009975 [Helicobacter sp. MIT 05-5294]
MKRGFMMLILNTFIFAVDFSNNPEWEKHILVSRKNLGFSLCVKEFYKNQNLPEEIEQAELAFSSIDVSDPDDKERFLSFIKANINKYMPKFKHPEIYPTKWYFVACLNMYNAKEYEDMILRKGRYAEQN